MKGGLTAAKHPLETPGNKASAQVMKTIDAAKRLLMGPTRSQQQRICMRGGLSNTGDKAST